MVDVVGDADAVGQAQEIADGGDHVVDDDVLGHQIAGALLDHLLELLGRSIFQDVLQDRQMDHLVNTGVLGIKGQPAVRADKVVAHDDAGLVPRDDGDAVDAGVLDGSRLLGGQHGALFKEHFARARVHRVLGQLMLDDAGSQGQLFVKLIAAHAHQVIALGVKEQAAQKAPGAVLAGQVAGLLLAVDFKEGFPLVLGGVGLIEGRHQALVLAQQGGNLRVGGIAQGAQEDGDGQLPGPVDADPQGVVGIGFIFQPRAAVRDHLGAVQALAALVDLDVKISARGADQLADDDAFRAVDDEGAMFGHQREIAHENLGFLDFTGLLVLQAHGYLERGGEGQVPLAAPFHTVLRFVRFQLVIDEFQHQIIAVIGDG